MNKYEALTALWIRTLMVFSVAYWVTVCMWMVAIFAQPHATTLLRQAALAGYLSGMSVAMLVASWRELKKIGRLAYAIVRTP